MISSSLTILMAQVLTNFKFSTSSSLHCIADDLELFYRGHNHNPDTLLHTNMTLTAEFDIVEQIYLTHKKYKIEPGFQHQDNHTTTKT